MSAHKAFHQRTQSRFSVSSFNAQVRLAHAYTHVCMSHPCPPLLFISPFYGCFTGNTLELYLYTRSTFHFRCLPGHVTLLPSDCSCEVHRPSFCAKFLPCSCLIRPCCGRPCLGPSPSSETFLSSPDGC